MKSIAILAGALALVLLLSACAVAPATTPVAPPPATQEPSPSAVAATPAADVAAIVNGEAISLATYQAQLQTALASYAAQPGIDPKSAEGQAALTALRPQVLDWLIDQMLIDQAAVRLGIRVDDTQVAAQVELVRNQNPNGFADWLKANGFTEDTFREQTRSDLLGAAVRDLVTKDVPTRVEQVHVRHILVETQIEAQAVLDQWKKGGTTFEALAATSSRDESTSAQGGDLGFVPRGILAESVEKVAFALQPGQVSNPVQSPFGWHIVQVLERDPSREIAPEMLAALRQDAFMRWLDGERQKAQIQRFIKE